jgi:general secretion pathway protein M
MDAIKAFWAERLPRERLVLMLLAGVLGAALTYLMLIEPAAAGIPRLERQLPARRMEAVQLDQLMAEVNNLKSRPQVATIAPSEARSALEASIGKAGLKASRIVPLADGDLQVTFVDVSYAKWSTWLAGAERELGARASNVNARANKTPGNADIEVALRLARK